MKILPTLAATLLLSVSAFAQTSTHHALTFKATVRTTSGDPGARTIKTVRLTNKVILTNYLTANPIQGVTVRDLDIAMDDMTAIIDIINIKDPAHPAKLTTIGTEDFQNGTTTTDGEVHQDTRKGSFGYESISSYLIDLPGVTGEAKVDLFLHVGTTTAAPSGEFASVMASFFGGFGQGTPGVYVLQGTAATKKKTYSY